LRAVLSGLGFGDAAQGQFEAEGAKLADVVGDLAAEHRAGVHSSPGRGLHIACGVGQQLVQDLQLGVAERDLEPEPVPGGWGTFFPDPRLVAAIVDRVTFNAHILETGTQSYRLRTSKPPAAAESPAKPPDRPAGARIHARIRGQTTT
jgi:IstB-like ATP binding protein